MPVMKSFYCSLVCLATVMLLSFGSLAADVRPNILILLADDLGYADVGFMGGRQIQTPHIDRLAAAGARLEQFYVQPLCSPTRAALLTGRYPMRYGLQADVIRPWEKRGLPLDERMLPKALQAAGYTTAIVGKWHLGQYERAYLPTSRGFDHQYGHYCGAIDYFTHLRDGGFDWHRDDRVCRDVGYSTRLIASEAERLLREQPADKPFFLYVPFNAVHSPLEVPEKYCAPYASLPQPRRTYAGVTAAMDEAVGGILAALDARGFRKNTLVFFASDNGGASPGREADNSPLRGGKGSLYEGGTRVCACVAWEGHIKPGTAISQPLHIVDWYPTLLKLAGASLDQKLPLDGRDILPVLTQGEPSPHEEILLNTTPEGGAIRVGDWKLIVNRKRGRLELFNLAEDLSEKHDLSGARPEKVMELRDRYDALASQAAKPTNQPKPADFKAPKVWGEQD
jgi:arylsulfatase A-like enzyme